MRANASNADFSDIDDIVSAMRFCACARRWRATSRFFLRFASSILSFRSRSEFLSFSVSTRCVSHVCSSCCAVRDVLALAHERLLGEVVAAFLDREHRALLPVRACLILGVGLVAQTLFVGDRGGHLLLGLDELRPHVDQDLVQHLLGVFGPGDQIVDVRPQEGRESDRKCP